jgi:exopolysaccharide/PEP-CTERM locus tyrosine autokinase
MSRIESALEKAMLLRTGNTDSMPADLPLPPSLHHYVPPMDKVAVTNPLLVTANDPHTAVAEEYRKLKSILVQLTSKDNFQNSIMVTSCLANEGKSITALNLAITLAQEHDHTVLLVDADLRKPALQNYLGIDSGPGLSDCLTDGVDVEKVLIRTGIGKLTLLPAGAKVKNPVELFSSRKVKDLFMEMKRRYPDRYVIIDTPPVLPFTESRTLGSITDGVVFVVKEGTASRDEISEALNYLKGSTLLGIVYNQASIDNRQSRYYYY